MAIGRTGSELRFAQDRVAAQCTLRPTARGATHLGQPGLHRHFVTPNGSNAETDLQVRHDDLPTVLRHVLQRHADRGKRFAAARFEPRHVHRMVDVTVGIELAEADPKGRAMHHALDRTNRVRTTVRRRRLGLVLVLGAAVAIALPPTAEAGARRRIRVVKRATTATVATADGSGVFARDPVSAAPAESSPVPVRDALPAAPVSSVVMRPASPDAPVLLIAPTTTAPPPATTAPPTTIQPASGATQLGGCAVFPPDNPWNQDVRALPVRTESVAWVRSVNGGGVRNVHPDFGSNPDYGIPFVIVSSAQPGVPITFDDYGSESDPGPYPIPTSAPVEGGNDRHVLALQQGTCRLFELYNARPSAGRWTASSGAVFNLSSNALRPKGWTSADAAGLPILPGLARFDEVRSGVITHALRVTVPATQAAFIAPATHQAGSANTALPPMGARLRLRADFDLRAYHGDALVILTALQRYGMIVADNGSAWYISGATDPRWDDNDLDQLKRVPGTAFEFVGSTPIESNPV